MTRPSSSYYFSPSHSTFRSLSILSYRTTACSVILKKANANPLQSPLLSLRVHLDLLRIEMQLRRPSLNLLHLGLLHSFLLLGLDDGRRGREELGRNIVVCDQLRQRRTTQGERDSGLTRVDVDLAEDGKHDAFELQL